MPTVSETAKKRLAKLKTDKTPETWNAKDKGPRREDPALDIPNFKVNKKKGKK